MMNDHAALTAGKSQSGAPRPRLRLSPVSAMPLAALLCVALAVGGCARSLQRASTAGEADSALIAGYSDIRANRFATHNDALTRHRDWVVSSKTETQNILMISGGGAGGAFGVGVLAGWTKLNTRPSFDVVTGVSTGALIAPYAFLGSSYDDTLVHLYTSGIARDLVAFDGPFGLFGQSLLKSEPLRKLAERFITPGVLSEIAAAHREGRRLFVLTTNLDSQRGVIWNMGAIAASGNADALELFRDVVVASASIPGVYPAVAIQATANGRVFQELHSDGGSTSQILTPPLVAGPKPSKRLLPRPINLYAIVNNALIPEFDITPNKTVSAVGRAYATFVKAQAQSELTALYNYAKRTGSRFQAASIEEQVPYSMFNPFDGSYMQTVYRLGYERTIGGTLWKDSPVFR